MFLVSPFDIPRTSWESLGCLLHVDCSAGYQGGARAPGALLRVQIMTLDSGSANAAGMFWAGDGSGQYPGTACSKEGWGRAALGNVLHQLLGLKSQD